ncbi:hypothetical protein PR202_ga26403 [Eleusine coracana subsp. coracana]|uniref:UBA domain-containing protein n=1 Tax=Eleusine coracana subsp. coracana TaxID=191504 RepID=A0AAV5DDS9_ELECO|nr:hypothetical protein PR202_ga26403 [Eleusine coracana subsp. coracana]
MAGSPPPSPMASAAAAAAKKQRLAAEADRVKRQEARAAALAEAADAAKEVDARQRVALQCEEGEVTANNLLLGIWSDKESAGHKILASLGFDDEKASLLAKMADDEAALSPR